MQSRITKRNKLGFTLIEMMVFLFIFTTVSITFYKLFVTGMQAMGSVRQRLSALALANEKMEVIRNLDYEKIGTIGGTPNGDLEPSEDIIRDSKTLFVDTDVIYVDDPFDGEALLGTDASPNDSKQVRVSVSWEKENPSKEVVLVSTIVPPGIESIYTGGILSLHLIDNSGQGIPNANVTIRNDSLDPVVNTTLTTNEHGDLFLPQVVPADQSYNISISKNGYFPVRTYAPYPISSINPVDTDATVVASVINQKTLITDAYSTISLHTKTPLGEPVANISFSLSGGKQVGNTVVVSLETSKPVWAYDESSLNSGADGVIEFSEMSSGPYFFEYGESGENALYAFLQMDQTNNLSNSFNVSPGVTLDETAIVADKNLDSLWLTVVDAVDKTPIADSEIRLKKNDASYDVTLATNKFGKVYFPDSSAVLTSGEYKMDVSAVGYDSIADQAINIDKFTTQTIEMTVQ